MRICKIQAYFIILFYYYFINLDYYLIVLLIIIFLTKRLKIYIENKCISDA